MFVGAYHNGREWALVRESWNVFAVLLINYLKKKTRRSFPR